MAFDPYNPFKFSNWENVYDVEGGSGSGDDVELGNLNVAGQNDCTQLVAVAADNVVLVGQNTEDKHGAVGVLGESLTCAAYAIGTAGNCPSGVGVYGISRDGVGTVGRVMGTQAVETEHLEGVTPRVGVCGHALEAAGVGAH